MAAFRNSGTPQCVSIQLTFSQFNCKTISASDRCVAVFRVVVAVVVRVRVCRSELTFS